MALLAPLAAAVAFAVASALSWMPLADSGARKLGDLMFVLSQNAVLLVAAAYSVAAVLSILIRHRTAHLLVALSVLSSSAFALTTSRAWHVAMGSREFRATRLESREEALLSAASIRQAPRSSPPSTALVPVNLILDLGNPPEVLRILPLSRSAGGPPVIVGRMGALSPGLPLRDRVKLVLNENRPERHLDEYPPDWVAERLSEYKWLPGQRPRSQRKRR